MIKGARIPERDIDHIPFASGSSGYTRGDVENVRRGLDDSLAQQEARSKLAIMTGCAHHDRDAVTFDPDFEGLFHRHGIFLQAARAAFLIPQDFGQLDFMHGLLHTPTLEWQPRSTASLYSRWSFTSARPMYR